MEALLSSLAPSFRNKLFRLVARDAKFYIGQKLDSAYVVKSIKMRLITSDAKHSDSPYYRLLKQRLGGTKHTDLLEIMNMIGEYSNMLHRMNESLNPNREADRFIVSLNMILTRINLDTRFTDPITERLAYLFLLEE